ncbi:hypothetical protein NEHOM01_1290 [Nematocida homosporus]|uniref:uncharacterized protein n=1 Tax=Nematocida homosporus TaxID=1912981 RepID=UPI00222124E2|nr:uncharacterized protein NEHOM01_1290 [Nematocida homosporus]KAI5186108.1 hypothetical protein NEHOM01_1290 [Nematocida homosporus]
MNCFWLFISLFSSLGLIQVTNAYFVGIDDSFLNASISIGGAHLTAQDNKKEIVNSKGLSIDSSGAIKLDNDRLAVYSPQGLIFESEEETYMRFPFLRRGDRGGPFTVKHDSLYTDLPVSYLYGVYLGEKLRKFKDMPETKCSSLIPASLCLTVRAYATSEQKAQALEAATEAARRLFERSVTVGIIGDDVAIAADYIAPGTVPKIMQVYVLRGRMVVASLLRYTPEKKRLTAVYTPKVFPIYDENELYQQIEEYLVSKLVEIVASRKKNNMAITFYGGTKPIRCETHPETDLAKEENEEAVLSYSYNILPLVNSILIEINNEHKEDALIEFEQIVLEQIDTEEKQTIVPRSEQSHHRINVAPLKSQLYQWVQDKVPLINDMVAAVEAKRMKVSKKRGQEDIIPEVTLVYNDVFVPTLFRTLLSESRLNEEKCQFANKSSLSLGAAQVRKVGIQVEYPLGTIGVKSALTYVLNGEQKTNSGVEHLLNNESKAMEHIQLIWKKENLESHDTVFKGLDAEEKEGLFSRLFSYIGNRTVTAFGKSPERSKAVADYMATIKAAAQRESIRLKIEDLIRAILDQLSEGTRIYEEALPHIPKEAESFQQYLDQISAEVKDLQAKKPSLQVRKMFENVDTRLALRIGTLQKEYNEFLRLRDEKDLQEREAKAKAELEAKEGEGKEGEVKEGEVKEGEGNAEEPTSAPVTQPVTAEGGSMVPVDPADLLEQSTDTAPADPTPTEATVSTKTQTEGFDSGTAAIIDDKPHFQADL